MSTLVAGLVLFLGAHSISIVAEPFRNRMVARLGKYGWQAAYGLLSLVGIVLIVQGYGAARMDPVVLWYPPVWLRHVALLLMLPVFVLLLATYLPGRISRATKHPTLVAVKAWAVAHLLANGMLADVLLFGAFLAWAVADRISMKKREQRPLPGVPPNAANDVIALVAGLAIYALFVWGGVHLWLFGVPPVG